MSVTAYNGKFEKCRQPPDPLIGIAIIYDKSCGFPPYGPLPADAPNSFLGGYASSIVGNGKTSVATYTPAASTMLYSTRVETQADDPADCSGFGPPTPTPGEQVTTEQYDASCVYSTVSTNTLACGGNGVESLVASDPVDRFFQISHQPTTSGYLGVWVRGVITASAGGGTLNIAGSGPNGEFYIFDPVNGLPTIWPGNPPTVIPDPTQPVYSNAQTDPLLVANTANTIKTDPTDATYKITDSTWESVEVYKWSLWPPYVPPDDGSANGCPGGIREVP